jgi:hypothetical protein
MLIQTKSEKHKPKTGPKTPIKIPPHQNQIVSLVLRYSQSHLEVLKRQKQGVKSTYRSLGLTKNSL